MTKEEIRVGLSERLRKWKEPSSKNKAFSAEFERLAKIEAKKSRRVEKEMLR